MERDINVVVRIKEDGSISFVSGDGLPLQIGGGGEYEYDPNEPSGMKGFSTLIDWQTPQTTYTLPGGIYSFVVWYCDGSDNGFGFTPVAYVGRPNAYDVFGTIIVKVEMTGDGGGTHEIQFTSTETPGEYNVDPQKSTLSDAQKWGVYYKKIG